MKGLPRIALAAACALCQGASSARAAQACPPTTAFSTALDHLEGYRVTTGADGDSEVAPFRVDAKQVKLLQTGKLLGLIQLPTAPTRGVQIVVGPADVDLPLHPAPYREMFIMLAGSVTLKTTKHEAELRPGSVVLFDDVTATHGHGGRTGPCGYVSVSIAP